MVDVIAPVLGVLEDGTTALAAGMDIAAVEREVARCNGGVWRFVTRALGMELFKGVFGLPLMQGFAQGACSQHLRGRPAVIAHAFPAPTRLERATALLGLGLGQLPERRGIQKWG